MTQKYLLKLFISGSSPADQMILRSIFNRCNQACPGEYELMVVDIDHDPEAAEAQQVLITPLLLRESPLPEIRLVGDLSDLSPIFSGHFLNGKSSNGKSSNGNSWR